MKKNITLLHLLFKKCNKIMLIMRITAFLILLSALNVMAEASYSQTARVSLDLKGTTVKEVLKSIENQSEFYFLYNNELVDVNRKVDVSVKNDKIENILTNLFGGKGVEFFVKDRHIILTPVNEITILMRRLENLLLELQFILKIRPLAF